MSEKSAEYIENIPKQASIDHFVEPFIALDKDDILRRAIITYAQNISSKDAMSANDQREAVLGARDGNVKSLQTLMKANEGLIAALAFPHRVAPHDELIARGEAALVEAINTYDTRQSGVSFTNFAIPIVDAGLEEEYGVPEEGTFLAPGKFPVYSVYRFVEKMAKVVRNEASDTKPRRPMEVRREISELRETEGLYEALVAEQEKLQYVSLSVEDIQNHTGLSIAQYERYITVLRKKWKIPTIEMLVALGVEAGVEFQARNLDRVAKLTPLQRQIALLSYQPQDKIAADLGLGRVEITKTVNSIRDKLCVMQRHQMFVMVEKYERYTAPTASRSLGKTAIEADDELSA